jgi:hypothetical protein
MLRKYFWEYSCGFFSTDPLLISAEQGVDLRLFMNRDNMKGLACGGNKKRISVFPLERAVRKVTEQRFISSMPTRLRQHQYFYLYFRESKYPNAEKYDERNCGYKTKLQRNPTEPHKGQ